jgi:hypothetical protein
MIRQPPDPSAPDPDVPLMHTIWREEERKRRRQVVVATGIAAVAVAVAAYLLGVGVLQCLLLVTAVTTVGAAFLALNQLDDDPSLPPVLDIGDSSGTRREVARMSWVMTGYDNRVGRLPYLRLRAIATTRLAWRGIDLATTDGDRAARELLGPVGYAVLVADSPEAPTERQFVACVTLLERLDGAPATAAPAATAGAAVGSAPTEQPDPGRRSAGAPR